jgi:hypothetical protein
MMVGCEAASGNPWWCRVHESRIRFHVNPPTGGANDCDNFRDALDLAEEVQEKVLAHAEAVAAKLVEVICEDAATIAAHESAASNLLTAWRNTRAERDAARAEVDRLNIEIGKVVDSRERNRVEMGQKVIDANREAALARAEVAALRELVEVQGRNIRREVLADLTARVKGLPYRTWVPPHATDCPGRPGKRGICTCGDSLRASDWMLRADVLALIEEAGRG